MIPIVSEIPIIGTLSSPDNIPKRPTIAYSLGGIGLSDPTKGLAIQIWRAWFDRESSKVFIESPNTPAVALFDQDKIVWLTFAFDQNMRWTAAYTLSDGKSYLRWFNTISSGYEVTEIGEKVVSPLLTLDDKRPSQSASSDVILAYIQNQIVYVRVQRERFSIPHVWSDNIPEDWSIRNFGMNSKLRLQMEIR